VALTATTGFSINSVFWLRSLSDSEQGPTRRVLEDLEPFFAQIGVPFQLRDVKTPGELYAALQSLANSMVKPIVQLDMHGTREGLVFVGSGEVSPWREVVPRLRAINVASGANLCVVAGVCFAFYAISEASIIQASPVNVLIAPDTEVQTGKLEDGLAGFYRSLFTDGSISAAFEKSLGLPFKVFHAERFLVIAICKYILNHCKGKGVEERRERLLTELLTAGKFAEKPDLSQLRKQIKGGIRPDQDTINRFANTFLLGRPCPFTIDQLLNEVEKAQYQ
jgi:hypothetical protein